MPVSHHAPSTNARSNCHSGDWLGTRGGPAQVVLPAQVVELTGSDYSARPLVERHYLGSGERA
jgi:hypothetical protein